MTAKASKESDAESRVRPRLDERLLAERVSGS